MYDPGYSGGWRPGLHSIATCEIFDGIYILHHLMPWSHRLNIQIVVSGQVLEILLAEEHNDVTETERLPRTT